MHEQKKTLLGSRARKNLWVLLVTFLSLLFFFLFNGPQMLFHEISSANLSFGWFLMLLFFSFVCDNARIYFRDMSLVASSISVMANLIWVGPFFAATTAGLITVFRLNRVQRNENSIALRIANRASVIFLMYFVPIIVFQTPLPFGFKLLLFFPLAEATNILLVHVFNPLTLKIKRSFSKPLMEALLLETLYPLLLIPIATSIENLRMLNFPGLFGFFLFFPLMELVYYLVARFYTSVIVEKEEKKKLSRFKKGLESVLETLKFIRSTEETDRILEKAITRLAQALEFRRALVSLVDPDSGMLFRVSAYGITPEDMQKLKKKGQPLSVISQMLDPRFEFGGAFFIPEETNMVEKLQIQADSIPTEIKFAKKVSSQSWKKDDLFLVPFRDSSNNFLGYISLDDPINNNRPTIEEAEIAKIFAEQIGRILESSTRYREAVEKSKRDPMTGLYNHSHFYEILDERIQDSNPRHPLSVIMLDIDDFKKFNDTHGHQIGDTLLVMVARIILQLLPSDAIGARYGGEEFSILLPNTGKIKAMELAHRICKEVAQTNIHGNHVTLSGGVAAAPEDGFHSSTLVSAADSALYVSKRSGKDQITAA